MKRHCELQDWGMVPYAIALQHQRSLVQTHKENPSQTDVLILVEHPPVYTLGQGASLEFLKFDPILNESESDSRSETVRERPELHRIERGGEVTYHCPGQLVGYPILNLKYYQTDLHWYLRQLEEVIIQTLISYGLIGERIPGLTGVWLEGHKIAAIGIKVSRWITMHGFALNVCPDLTGFQKIVPCGIADRPVGSLAQFLPEITVAEVKEQVAIAFSNVFQVELDFFPQLS